MVTSSSYMIKIEGFNIKLALLGILRKASLGRSHLICDPNNMIKLAK